MWSTLRNSFVGFLFFGSSLAFADWQHQIGLHSDYFHRGLTYAEQPLSVNWLSQYQSEMGLYAGLWASFHSDDTASRNNEELNLWLGYTKPLTNRAILDISWSEFIYPNDSIEDYDWRELLVSVHFQQRWTIATGIHQDRFADGDRGTVFEVTHRVPWFGNVVDLTAGYLESDNFGLPVVTEGNTSDSGYWYYELGMSRSIQQLKGLQVRAALVGTNQADLIVRGLVLAEAEATLSLSYSF